MSLTTIYDKLQEANEIKEAIRTATKRMDTPIPDDASFAEFPTLIEQLSGRMQKGKEVIPTAEGGVINPDDGYDGFENITLPAEPSLIPSKIAAGASIFGVFGTAETPTFDFAALFDGTLTDFTSGITSLRDYAFYKYSSTLKTVELRNLTKIGEYAFSNCVGITSVKVPKLSKVSAYAFDGCGELKNIDMSNVVEIEDYGLGNCRKVIIDGALKTPMIGSYACYYFGSLATNGFIYQPEVKATIKTYGLSSSGVKELIADIASVEENAVSYCDKLNKLHANISGSIGNYGFYQDYYVSDLDLSESTIKSIGTYTFYKMGCRRQNPSENRLVFDLKKSEFQAVSQYAFAGDSTSNAVKYADIYLPDTVDTINAYAFRYTSFSNIYFKSAEPPNLSATTCFDGATNYKLFVPYNSCNKYYTETNWTVLKEKIVGYAPVGTFAAGELLPTMNNEGMALTWYSDADKTAVITVVPEENAELYCDALERIACVVNVNADANTTLSLTDSYGAEYTSFPALIPLGRGITLSLLANDGWENRTSVNGEAVEFPYIVSELSGDISIKSRSWQGEIDTDFANCTWQNIKNAVYTGAPSSYFKVGDTRTITTKSGGTYVVRLANIENELYEYEDGRGKTGFIMEFVDLWKDYNYMNPSGTNQGGWDASYMRNTVMPLIIADLPDDLVDAIAFVKTKATKSGTDGTIITSIDKLFLPTERELFSSRQYSRLEEWRLYQQWEYYAKNNTDGARVKKKGSSAYNWYGRSAFYSDNRSFFCVGSRGSASAYDASSSFGVGISFTI